MKTPILVLIAFAASACGAQAEDQGDHELRFDTYADHEETFLDGEKLSDSRDDVTDKSSQLLINLYAHPDNNQWQYYLIPPSPACSVCTNGANDAAADMSTLASQVGATLTFFGTDASTRDFRMRIDQTDQDPTVNAKLGITNVTFTGPANCASSAACTIKTTSSTVWTSNIFSHTGPCSGTTLGTADQIKAIRRVAMHEMGHATGLNGVSFNCDWSTEPMCEHAGNCTTLLNQHAFTLGDKGALQSNQTTPNGPEL